MNITETGHSTGGPALQDETPVAELVVALVPGGLYDKGAVIAAGLCERWHTRLKLVHVGSDQGPLEEAAMRVAAAHPGVEVSTMGLDGPSIAGSIAGLAEPDRLLVVETTHATGSGTVRSTADDILRSYPGPVLLLGPETDSEHVSGDVVIGVDGSPLAETAIEPGAALSKSLDAPLWIVSVVPAAVSEQVRALRARGERVSESGYARSVAENLVDEGTNAGWEIVNGDDPVEGIVGFVRQRSVGFIVVGTHGESGFQRLALGSVCMGIVAKSPVPVLAIKSKEAAQFALTAGRADR